MSTPWSMSSGGSYSYGSSQAGEQYPDWALRNIQALYPQLQRQFSTFSQPFWSAQYQAVGGDRTPFPEVTVGGIWDDDQIQARVNQMRAMNDATTQTRLNDVRKDFAGRGFGGDSPLYNEYAVGLDMANRLANTQGENDLRWNAASGNAAYRQEGERMNLDRSRLISDDDIRRRQLQLAGYGESLRHASSLLDALTAMNRPLSYSQSKNKSYSSYVSSSQG